MRIKQITSQIRRDMFVDYECEHCGYVKSSIGYDDDYFYVKVIPAMKCPECGKTADESYMPRKPKYPDSQVV